MAEEAPFDTARFAGLMNLAKRPSAFAGEGFDVQNDTWDFLKILVVGAGGLGCELLHALALAGFANIDVIDLDTIDLSNLNRQFLFRDKDVGNSKASVAAAAVMARCPWMKITPHYGRVESMPDSFYQSFNLVLLGLDSVYARQWMNAKMAALGTWIAGEKGVMQLQKGSTVPVLDGGTEGFKGSCRVVQFCDTACVECWTDRGGLYPPATTVPECTFGVIPRAPEHCVLYIKEKVWKESEPFGPEVEIDGDNAEHITWIAQRAEERREQFQILGDPIDYAFALGVTKNVVPAVGFTNALIAGQMVIEALKLATGIGMRINNFGFYNGAAAGVTSYVQQIDRDPSCPVCTMASASASLSLTPQQLIGEVLKSHQMSEVWGLKKAAGPFDMVLHVTPLDHSHPRCYLQFNTNNPLTKPIVGDTIAAILQHEWGLSDSQLKALLGRTTLTLESKRSNIVILCILTFDTTA